MKMQLILLSLFALVGTSWGQSQTIVIHTSAECEQCEERLENGLNYTKGVIFAELDLETQNVTVKYNTKKLDADQVKAVITSLGYDADDRKADPAALNKLPECCRPGGMGAPKHNEGQH